MPANQKHQNRIYKWFHSSPDKTTLHRSPGKADDEAWEEFCGKLDLENQTRRSYCLLVSKFSNETQNLQALANFSWLQVCTQVGKLFKPVYIHTQTETETFSTCLGTVGDGCELIHVGIQVLKVSFIGKNC